MEEVVNDNEALVENIPFEFTGKGGEYFAIWIVNVALTILTFGIYSAWAKVRNHQYFYGNTLLDGSSFRYTANPIHILQGRIIALAIFMAYATASAASPIISAAAIIILMLLVPAFMVMSMSFRLRNSVYRNVKFNFEKNFKQAYKVFAIPVVIMSAYFIVAAQITSFDPEGESLGMTLPIAMMALLLLVVVMVPWWEYMITHFKAVHAKYGQSEFEFTATNKSYYIMYLKMYGMMIVIFGLMGGMVAAIISLAESTGEPVLWSVIIILVFPTYLWLFAYMEAKRTNLVFSNLHINGNQLKSELKTGYLLWLYISNTLAMMLTVGLLMPWAKIRTARYRASVTSLNVSGDLSLFVADQEQKQSAYGEEMGEMFDMDLGF